MALAAPKVQSSKFKVQSYEKGYLEIHHSDRSSHTDCHRDQPWSYQLYVERGSLPLAPPKRRGTRKRMSNIAHPLICCLYKQSHRHLVRYIVLYNGNVVNMLYKSKATAIMKAKKEIRFHEK